MRARQGSTLFAGKLPPLIGSLITAILCCLPHLMALKDLGRDYTPFSVGHSVSASVWDESHAYAPGPARFMRTGSLVPESDVYEMRFAHSVYPIFHAIVLGFMGRALGSLEAAWILADAIFPALYFLLLYQIFGCGVSNQALRVLISWACLIIPFGPRNFLLLGQEASIQPLDFTRTPNPELTLPLLLLSCYLIIRAIGNDSWGRILLAGLCVGLNFYAYYFYAITIVITLGIVLALVLLLKKAPARPLILISVIGAVVALPAIYGAYLAMREGAQKHLTDRMGFYSHAPESRGLILLGVALLCAGYTFHRLDRRQLDSQRQFLLWCVFLFALVAAGGVGLNLQLITGFDAQHEHFWNRLIQPAGAVLLSLIVARAVETPATGARWMTMLSISCAVMMLGLTCFRQGRIAKFTEQDHRRSAPTANVLEWARSQTKPDEVLGTLDVGMNLLNPAVASRWNFVPISIRSMAPDDDILKRYLIMARLLGMSLPDVERILSRKDGTAVEPWRDLEAMFHPLTEQDLLNVREIWATLNVHEELKTRKLDYLITPLAANICVAAPSMCPEDVVYTNRLWKVIRVSGRY